MDMDRAGSDVSSGKWMDGLVEPLVSIPARLCSTNVSRYGFQPPALTLGSKNLARPFWGASVWLRSMCVC